MYLVTASQMAAIDRHAIDELGIPGIQLMHNAGKAVADEIVARAGSVAGDHMAVLCGRGNNGGDGFVVARLLRDMKAEVMVYLVSSDTDAVSGHARTAMEEWLACGGEIVPVTDDAAVQDAMLQWADADMIVDGLLGTGLSGEVRGVARSAIDAVNTLRVPIVAIDIPSGISGDTGQVHGAALTATLTVSFGLPKIGQAFYPGKKHCGTLSVADIGFPQESIDIVRCTTYLTGQDDARSWMPRRNGDVHKGSVGRALVVAGSVGMTGAAAMSGESALRAGAGLVYLACPESLNDILESLSREVITLPVPENSKKRCLALRALGDVRRHAADMSVAAIGPGIGRHRETMELVCRFVAGYEKPLVIDADALFALSPLGRRLREDGEPPVPLGKTVVLTPHYGEFARLLGCEIADVQGDPSGMCRRAADEWGVTVLLKGAPTIVCGPSGETWVNPTGNAGMATAGAGDVLTGVITGLIAQGCEPEIAARLGAYAHGVAGDFARDDLGVHGMIAGDILRNVPKALKGLVPNG